MDDILKAKLEAYGISQNGRAVQFLTINDVDELANQELRRLYPTELTPDQRELANTKLTVGSQRKEIRTLRAALNNRDIDIKRLKQREAKVTSLLKQLKRQVMLTKDQIKLIDEWIKT